MAGRKTPILLRRGPVSGTIQAIHCYTMVTRPNGASMVRSATNGKQDVQADFDTLMLEELCDPDSPNIAEILDGVAQGRADELTPDELQQVRSFRERLVAVMLRHNARLTNQ